MDHVQTISDVYAAFGRGDLAHVLERIAPEVDWGFDPRLLEEVPAAKAVPWLRHSTTRAEVAEQYFAAIAANADFDRFDVVSVMGDGDRVLAILEVAFTVKATGVRVAAEESHHFLMDADGRIARYRNGLDTARVIAAFGA